jgi:hypothetical protein
MTTLRTNIGCTPARWTQVATAEAIAANLNVTKLLAGSRETPYVQARWRAWQTLAAAGCSKHSIAAASGFDRTAVRYACDLSYRAIKYAQNKAGFVPVARAREDREAA